jgi:CHAT domain-containing protein
MALLEPAIAAAAHGRGEEVKRTLNGVAPLLYQLPPGCDIDRAGVDAVLEATDGATDVQLVTGLRIVAVLGEWHLDGAREVLMERCRPMLASARTMAEALDPARDGETLRNLADTVLAVCSLLDLLDSAPADAVAVLTSAAASSAVPFGEPHEVRLLVNAWRWSEAAGISTETLRGSLGVATSSALRELQHRSFGPWTRDTLALCLSAFELMEAREAAQRVRLDLAAGLLSEQLHQQAEPLLAQLREPVVVPGQELIAELLRIRLFLCRRQVDHARAAVQSLRSKVPSGHGLEPGLLDVQAAVHELSSQWAEAVDALRPLVASVVARGSLPEPMGSMSCWVVVRAATAAWRAGDRVRLAELRQELAVVGTHSVVGNDGDLMIGGWVAVLAGDHEQAAALQRAAADAVMFGLSQPPRPDRVAALPALTLRSSIVDTLASTEATLARPGEVLRASEELRGEFLRAGTLVRSVLGGAPGVATFLDAAARRRRPASQGTAAGARLCAQSVAMLRQAPLRALVMAPLAAPADVEPALAAVLATAGTGWGVVSVGMADDALWAVAADSRGSHVKKWRVDAGRLTNELLQVFCATVGAGPRPDDPAWIGRAERCLAALDPALGAGLRWAREQVSCDRLVVSLNGPLLTVPLGAVGTPGGRSLVDEFAALAVVPGLAWAAGRCERPTAPVTAVTAGASVDETIALAVPEVALLAGAYRRAGISVESLIPLAQADLAASVGRSQVVHLAAHAAWNHNQVVRSGIALADGEELDSGELLAALDFGSTELAVLSACDTAISSFLATGDAINLASMVLMAGARQVVASLWKVDDEPTLITMVELHRRVAAGAEPAEALLAAQRATRHLDQRRALELFDEWRADIDDADDVLRDSGLVDRWQRRDAEALPFRRLEAWAPFTCMGPPTRRLCQ